MDSSRQVKSDPRRGLPAVDRLQRELREARPDLPEWAVAEAARRELARVRSAVAEEGAVPDLGALREQIAERAADLAGGHPRRVVNATGIPLHTNLGRAPLAPGAARAVAEAAAGYAAVELDVASGRRGQRGAAVGEKLRLLSGAPAAHVVNNNAAAVLLALDTLARGREVIVSRGELVEIGGSFRVPDIMARADVRLVEVGTTNRTHLRDYEAAITPDTALLLKVHRSNFEITGFVAEVGLGELAALGRRRGIPVLEDLGSATLVDLTARGLPAESYAPSRLRLGAQVVCFSGDKLLGGPQAGIALGDVDPVGAMRRNPLARALRLDKLGLAALDWTLEALLDGRGETEIPVLRQLLAPDGLLETRAQELARRLAKRAGDSLRIEVERDRAEVGGGSLPGFVLDTWVVSLRSPVGAEALAAGLRRAALPVLARIRDDRVVIDVRTLLEGDEDALEAALDPALAPPSR